MVSRTIVICLYFLRMRTAKKVGAGLLAKAVCQSIYPVTGTLHSRASPLPQGIVG